MTRLAIRRLDQTGASVLGNVVKADAYQIVAEADRLVVELQAHAERACQAAEEASREAGEAAGREAGARVVADTVAAAESYLRKSEKRLVGIVMAAVTRILGEFDDVELATRMVRRLIDEAEEEGGIRLRVSPAQAKAIAQTARELQAAFPGARTIEVIADPEVADGACRMQTELGFVDTSIDGQLRALREALETYGDD